MAQKRYHNYKRPLVSIDENLRLLGFMKPGRYAGFDTFTGNSGNLNFTIDHTATGIPEIELDGTPTSPMGSIITPGGTVIKEDSPISLSIETNELNDNNRIDLVVVEHSHEELEGGSPATYSVVTGPLNGTTPPAVPLITTMIVVGILIVPNNATSTEHVIYVPKTKPTDVTGAITPWVGNFSPTGSVIGTLPEGKALANGTGYLSNGLPIMDLRGKFLVGYDDSDGDYDEVGKVGPIQSPTPELQYDLVDGGKKIRLGTFAVPPHFHEYIDTFVNAKDGEDDPSLTELSRAEWADHLGIPNEAAQYSGTHYSEAEITEGSSSERSSRTIIRRTSWGQYKPYDVSTPDGESIRLPSVNRNNSIPTIAIENRPPFLALVYLVTL